MFNDRELREAKRLYKYYAFKTKGGYPHITENSPRVDRAVYVMLGISRHFHEENFEEILKAVAPDIPFAGAPENRLNRIEHQLIKTLQPLRPSPRTTSWEPSRNDANEPEEDGDASPIRALTADDWTPINTNSENYVWLNKVANLFELPGASKDENIPFILKIKQMREQQSHDQSQENKSRFNLLDYAQMGLDAAGFFEPTPFADSANATVSLLRAIAEPKQAGSHLMNAGISIASALPYVGDYAKLYKSYGKNDSSLVDLLGASANNRSRIGRMSGMLYRAMGGQSLSGANSANANQTIAALSTGNLSNLQQGGAGGAANVLSVGGIGSALPITAGATSGGGGSSLTMLAGTFARLSAVAGLVITGFVAVTNWAEKTAQKGREMLDSQRPGARWSAQASSAMLQYDFGRIQREGERGRYLAPATSFLAQSQNFVEQNSEEYFAPYVRASTNLQGGLNYVAGAILKTAQSLDVVRWLLQSIFDMWPEKLDGPANPIDAYQQKPNPIPTKPKKFNVV